MYKKIKKWIDWDNAPFMIIFVVFLLVNIKMKTNFGDDVYHREHSQNVWVTVINAYKTWASPSLITVIQLYLVKLPDFIFKIINIAVIMLSAYSIFKIAEDKNSKYQKWMIAFLIILYPFMQMNTAGWIVTCTLYYFCLAFGLYSLLYLRYIIDGKKISILQYVLFWFSLILGLGNVQMCCIILGIYTVFNIFLGLKKKIFKYSIFQNVTSIIFLVYHLISPGNKNRNAQETITWFPDFNMISTLNKIKLGFTSTLGDLISRPNLFFLCFCLLIAIGVWCKYKTIVYRLISVIPFLSVLIFGVFGTISLKYSLNIFPRIIGLLNNGSNDFIRIDSYNYFMRFNYLSIVLGFTILGAMLTSIYLIFENTLKTLLIEVILLSGFCSRMIMSFSPTIYASSTRTFIFLYFSMIICGTFIFNEISQNLTQTKQKYLLAFIGAVSVLNLVMILIKI